MQLNNADPQNGGRSIEYKIPNKAAYKIKYSSTFLHPLSSITIANMIATAIKKMIPAKIL